MEEVFVVPDSCIVVHAFLQGLYHVSVIKAYVSGKLLAFSLVLASRWVYVNVLCYPTLSLTFIAMAPFTSIFIEFILVTVQLASFVYGANQSSNCVSI